ncbi:MAG: hypothetical protein KGL39_32005, partial [Patescibacteria group bacterium]|nr:hypothetical protein [Patescibacteria group bacterium]
MNYTSLRENYWRAMRHFVDVSGDNKLRFIIVHPYNVTRGHYFADQTEAYQLNLWEQCKRDYEFQSQTWKREGPGQGWPEPYPLPREIEAQLSQIF